MEIGTKYYLFIGNKCVERIVLRTASDKLCREWKIRGAVEKDGRESKLGVLFDLVFLPGGENYPL